MDSQIIIGEKHHDRGRDQMLREHRGECSTLSPLEMAFSGNQGRRRKKTKSWKMKTTRTLSEI